MNRSRLILVAGSLALPALLGGCLHTLAGSAVVVAAGEVLPPVASAVGIVIDAPKVWSEVQVFVDARALTVPPQPMPVTP
jgi:hypothetical protein